MVTGDNPEEDNPMQITVIRCNGDEEQHKVRKDAFAEIYRLIGCDCSDIVNLRDGRVMIVDDVGLIDGKERNEKATALYRGVCRPGTDAWIAGDVAIALDEDFA
jgi:hypothetical protein